jgi:hypothetical protein
VVTRAAAASPMIWTRCLVFSWKLPWFGAHCGVLSLSDQTDPDEQSVTGPTHCLLSNMAIAALNTEHVPHDS